jgi:hypothetical protein
MATYYFRNTGTNWGNSLNWSATPFSSGYTAGAIPASGDDAVFEAASASCTVDTGVTRNCRSLNCTSYTGTITFDTTLNVVGGNITLGTTSMALTGTFGIISNLSGVVAVTYSSAGCVCTVSLSITRAPGGAVTITMGSNWTQRGNFSVSNSGSTTTFNGNTITFDRTCTISHGTSIAGTTTFLLAPIAGNTVTEIGGGQFAMPLTISGSGNVTLNQFAYAASTFTYTPGSSTVTHTGTLTMASGTYNTAGIIFQNGQTNPTLGSTTTLTSDITFSENFTVPGSSPTINGVGRKVIVGGNFTNNSAGGPLAGTASIMMNGTGTLSGGSVQAVVNTIEINTGGTVTISGTIQWLRNLLFNGGTVISTGSSIICPSPSTFIINATGFNMDSFACTTVTFSGTQGCTISSYTCTTAGSINTFASTETYNITNSLNVVGTAASNVAFRSSTAGIQANVILTLGSTMSVAYVDADDINSAGGQTIWNYQGTLTNTVNWNLLQNPITVGYPWVR